MTQQVSIESKVTMLTSLSLSSWHIKSSDSIEFVRKHETKAAKRIVIQL